MAELKLGRVRGSMWYAGTSIDGTDTTSHVYPTSGIAQSYELDKYLNGTTGNVYECTKAGEATVAEWLLVGNIKGAAGDLENSLTSTSITKGLTARMGKVLNDKINNAGIFPFAVKTSYADKTYTAKVTVENISTALTFTDVEGNTGRYTYVKAGSDDTAEVVVTIGTSIGMTVGAILDSIESSDAAIKSYILLDSFGNEVENIECNLWQTMNRLVGTITRGASFNEGEDTFYTGESHAYINSQFEKVYAQSHIASIYYSIKDDLTLKAYLDSFAMTDEAEIKALTEVTSPLKTIEAYTLKKMIEEATPEVTVTELHISTEEEAFLNLDVKVELIANAEGKTEVIDTKFVDGEVSVPVKNVGTYKVSVVYDGEPYSQNVDVPYFGIYPVAIFKDRAWFEVSTADTELFGKSFKFSSGGKNYPGTIDSNGLATVYVQLKGVYTFAFDDTSLADKIEYIVPTVSDFFVGYPMLITYQKATITVKTSEEELKGQTVTITDNVHDPISKTFPTGEGEVEVKVDVNYAGTYTVSCMSTGGDTAEESIEVELYTTTNEVELNLMPKSDNIIPKMTADSDAYGTASAVSNYGSSNHPYHVFSQDESKTWIPANNTNTSDVWIQWLSTTYEMKPEAISFAVLADRSSTTASWYVSAKIQGYQDGAWVDISDEITAYAEASTGAYTNKYNFNIPLRSIKIKGIRIQFTGSSPSSKFFTASSSTDMHIMLGGNVKVSGRTTIPQP